VTSFRNDADKVDWQFYQWLRTTGIRKVYQRGASEFAFGTCSTRYED